MRYRWDWILFDADNTLFHFDAFAGLQCLFQIYGIDFTVDDYQRYQAINLPLWQSYQNGEITARSLQRQRFLDWGLKLNLPPEQLNQQYIAIMADICQPLDGATSLLHVLQDRVRIGIVTNGFTALQQARLQRTGLGKYVDLVVISEQVGFAKPHPAIFDYALRQMGHPLRDRVLMVGDNPESDILGGINAGFATCWLNPEGRRKSDMPAPTFQVKNLQELEALLTA